MKLKELPIDLQKKYVGELDIDGMSRIQYYPADLAYNLGLQGKIADMHVDTENGEQVLRMTVIPLQATEYKTIRAPKGTVPLPRPKKQPKTARRPAAKGSGKTVGDVVTEKVKEGVKNWWNKKDKPQFMKDAGY